MKSLGVIALAVLLTGATAQLKADINGTLYFDDNLGLLWVADPPTADYSLLGPSALPVSFGSFPGVDFAGNPPGVLWAGGDNNVTTGSGSTPGGSTLPPVNLTTGVGPVIGQLTNPNTGQASTGPGAPPFIVNPEPSTFVFLGSTLILLAVAFRRKFSRAA